MTSELAIGTCGKMTQAGTLCKWPADQCPVERHMRQRKMDDNIIAEVLMRHSMTKKRIDWDRAPRKRLDEADEAEMKKQPDYERETKAYWARKRRRKR